MKLNYDLLYLVMQHLELPQLMRMMHTCHAIYELRIPLVLKDITYNYRTNHSRLYHLLLLSNPTRFIYVTRLIYLDLSLCGWLLKHNLLMDFLQLSNRIQELEMKISNCVAFRTEDIARIALLADLRHLKLHGPFAAAELLQILTAPLKSLEIHLFGYSFGYMDVPLRNHVLHDPIPSIERLGPSLESSSFVMHTSADLPVLFTRGYSFPVMRKLEWRSWNPIDVATLTSTFPNLDSLTVGFYGLMDDLHVIGSRPLSHEQMVAYRNQNYASQQWSTCRRLKYPEGSILSLWTLGLWCEVEVLNIAVTPHKISQRAIHTLLAVTRPTHIQLSYSINSGQGLEYLRGRALIYETVQDLELKLSVVEYQLIHTAGHLVSCMV